MRQKSEKCKKKFYIFYCFPFFKKKKKGKKERKKRKKENVMGMWKSKAIGFKSNVYLWSQKKNEW